MGSPLLLAELALGTQGGQDWGAGTQAVAPTPFLQLLDVGQDLPLLRGWPLRTSPSPPPTCPPPPPAIPIPVSLTFLLFSKLMRSPWGQTLSELEPPESRPLRVTVRGWDVEPHCTKGAGVGNAGRVKGGLQEAHCAEGRWC